MVRRIIWSAKAQQERKDILQYWTKRNKSKTFSRKLSLQFNEAINLIARSPNAGHITPRENVRVKIVRDYLIIYKIEPASINILSIFDGRRNPEEFNKRL